MRIFNSFILAAFLAASALPMLAQQTGSIAGAVQDTLGAVVVGATVTVVASDGKEKTAVSGRQGEYSITGLAPGKYTVRVTASNFALYENTEVQITGGQRLELLIPLTVEAVEEQVDVEADTGVSTDPDASAGATVIKGKDLEALPDDPDELEAALQALAGASAGPNGGQIYIDGFTGGRLPPKEAIREIRVNQNPFSAEFDRLGFGRIEILTRPGSDKFRGNLFGTFNDESLNSRNPFAPNRAPSQTRFFGGNVSGPIKKGKSSYFLDFNKRDADTNTIVNAIVLDNDLNAVPFSQDIVVPTRRFSFSPRIDYQLNENNTLIFRYNFSNSKQENQGVGGLTLPSRGFETSQQEHEFRITETMIINPTTINETRFQFEHRDREQLGDNSVPAISVGSAFVGGGATIGNSFNRSRSWELNNNTTTVLGKNAQHSVKFGVRIRGNRYTDRSENNFGGSFSFTGIAPRSNPPGCDPANPPCEAIPGMAGLDQYRNTILQTVDPRYTFIPNMYTVTTGNPEIKISQYDYGVFFTDDWRVNPALTLSFGLRYEDQTNISDHTNFAPRFAFAWSPGAGGARPPKTVIRGGFGVFYERISDNLTLQAERFNGVNQLNLVVNANDLDPARRAAAIALLSQPVFTNGGVTNVPTADQILAVLPVSSTIRQIADDIQTPYYYQLAIGMERQLPGRTTLSTFYIATRTHNVLRTRNINAPECPNPSEMNCFDAPRPFPTLGNINEFESTGRASMQQLIVNFRSNFSTRVSLFGNYRLGSAKGDSDGAGSAPAYSYDLTGEYGSSGFDIRHSFMVGGNITLPWGISLNPFINATTGRPFNIYTGIDRNGDGFLTERPTFGELAARCDALDLTWSFCDTAGQDPNAIIPRNYGRGTGFFSTNLRFSKNFGFGSTSDGAGAQGGQGRGRGGPGGGGRGPGRAIMGGGPGMMMIQQGGDVRKPYNLNVSVQVNNLFNNVNFSPPIGNIASDRFGQVTSTQSGFGGFGPGGGGGSAANRRIELQLRFSW